MPLGVGQLYYIYTYIYSHMYIYMHKFITLYIYIFTMALHVAEARRFAGNVVDEFGIRSGHQLHSIANLGAGGKYENNAEKEFHLMLQGVFWAVQIL